MSRYRRHPALLAAVDTVDGERRLTVSVDDGRPALVIDDPRLLAGLAVLPEQPFTRAEAAKSWAEIGLGDIQDALWQFCTTGSDLITSADTGGVFRHDGYHQATRSYPFLDMGRRASFDTDNDLMRAYMASDPYPPVYSVLPHTECLPLDKAEPLPGAPSDVAGQLSVLLDGTFGERRRLDPSDSTTYLQVELLFKAVPSGGARHPVEALLWLRTDGFPEGLYHYSVKDNALHRMNTQPSLSDLAGACPALRTVTARGGPLLVVMLAAVVRRAMWRYRDPRSARAVLVDVGHVVQHLVELGAWTGWTWTDLPGFDADHVAGAADIDADTMPVLAMGALTR